MIGNKLKELRLKNNLTQGQLAQKLGISPSAVGMYEQNRREPEGKLIKKFAEFFGVSVDYLMSYNDNKEMELVIDQFKESLLSRPELLFNGEPVNDEDIGLIIEALKLGVETVKKKKAKEKE